MSLRRVVAAGALAVAGALAADRVAARAREQKERERIAARAVRASITLDAQADRLELEYNRVMAERDRRYAEAVNSISKRAFDRCKAQCEYDLPVALASGKAWCATWLGGCRERTEKRLQAEADAMYADYSARLERLAARKAAIEAQLTHEQEAAIR